MGRIVRRIALAVLTVALCLSLSACLKSVDDMFVLPSTSNRDPELQKQIDIMRDHGAEYIKPLSGDTRQHYATVDFDNDGNDEHVFFLKDKSDEYPLQVVVFWKLRPQYDTYNKEIIRKKGESIDSFSCCDLDGDGLKELIIGWRDGTNDKTLGVYRAVIDSSASNTKRSFVFEPVEMDASNYSDYRLCQFSLTPQENVTNIFIVRRKTNPSGLVSTTEREVLVYTLTKEDEEYKFNVEGPVGLSYVSSVQNIYIATLLNGTVAAYIDSETYYDGYATDIITYKNGQLANLIEQSKDPKQNDTMRPFKLSCTDIDGDGIIEVPIFQNLTENNRFAAEYAVRWCSYSVYSIRQKLTTYYCPDDSWYYILPDNNLDKLYVRRVNESGVNSVIFSYKGDSDDTDVLIINAYRGDQKSNYEAFTNDGKKFRLGNADEKAEVIYIGEVMSDIFPELTNAIETKFKLNYPVWMPEVSSVQAENATAVTDQKVLPDNTGE